MKDFYKNLRLLIDCFVLNSDDRPMYRSLQAILYGPHVLAGHTTGDWTINNVSANSLSSWITPIPADYNNHLVTFSQQSGNSIKSLMNANKTIIMGTDPSPGNNSALYSTHLDSSLLGILQKKFRQLWMLSENW